MKNAKCKVQNGKEYRREKVEERGGMGKGIRGLAKHEYTIAK